MVGHSSSNHEGPQNIFNNLSHGTEIISVAFLGEPLQLGMTLKNSKFLEKASISVTELPFTWSKNQDSQKWGSLNFSLIDTKKSQNDFAGPIFLNLILLLTQYRKIPQETVKAILFACPRKFGPLFCRKKAQN